MISWNALQSAYARNKRKQEPEVYGGFMAYRRKSFR